MLIISNFRVVFKLRGRFYFLSLIAFKFQDTKTSALKKSSRYRSRSLSASSTDSYSSGKFKHRNMQGNYYYAISENLEECASAKFLFKVDHFSV